MSTPNITWDQIRQQFTDIDIAHMKDITGGGLDLSDCESVHKWAQEIYNKVASSEMPPGSPWSQEWIDNFKAWIELGAPCPNSGGA
jgi:hypothetical protein